MTPLASHALAVAVAAGLAFGSGWKVRAWKCDAARTAEAEQFNRDLVRRAEAADREASDFEAGRSADEAREPARKKEVERVVKANPAVYSGACVDDAGLRILADEIAARRRPGQPEGAVP